MKLMIHYTLNICRGSWKESSTLAIVTIMITSTTCKPQCLKTLGKCYPLFFPVITHFYSIFKHFGVANENSSYLPL